ncbi:AAA domain-containing protein [Magnetospirillum fulvum]|uniref:AAA domain-containing protein n=2 Tax=Magnetospirillum fulvum TaxID=1082 RepID=A0A1H6HFB2_MAGFU|nr:AAA domain-containing protein [Magnetospirillum fulvum]
MDRLEKALQKARSQREAALQESNAAAARELPVSPDASAPATLEIRPKRSADVLLSDEVLERNRIVARMARSAEADIFRLLRTKLLQAMNRSNLRTIAITSPTYGDGKTTIAVNLAMSLALDVKQTVLLVDLDLRKPMVHRFLGFEPKVGLGDYVQNDAPVHDCMVKLPIDRLVVLPISAPIENSSELLGTPKMIALANELKTRYADRIVIYDMPPLLAQDDVITFLPNVDGVLLVARDGVTRTDDLKNCLHSLGDSNVIGTVLNGSNERQFNRA